MLAFAQKRTPGLARQGNVYTLTKYVPLSLCSKVLFSPHLTDSRGHGELRFVEAYGERKSLPNL